MPRLIKDRTLVADRWQLLRDAMTNADVPACSAVIVPLALWRAERAALLARGDAGLWLGPADDPAQIAADLASLPVVAIDFPQFADGRGYSTARLLRQRYGYRRELRAVGDILRDQLFALEEVGFDAFLLREDVEAAAALASFDDFRSVYAPTVGHPAPWFRRRHGGASPGDRWSPEA
jgi:uncharacterized protein (DUF934 family)